MTRRSLFSPLPSAALRSSKVAEAVRAAALRVLEHGDVAQAGGAVGRSVDGSAVGVVPADTAAWHDVLGSTPQDLVNFARGQPYRLHYGGDFDSVETLRYLGRDPNNLAERVDGNQYRRILGLGGRPVALALTLEAQHCTVAADIPAAGAQGAGTAAGESAALDAGLRLRLHDTVRHMLGLEQPLAAFHAHAGQHPVLGGLVGRLRGVRMPQVPGLWEALCWAVIGQQINLAFAYRLRNRIIALGNGVPPNAEPSIEPSPMPTAPLPFPTPEQVLAIPEQAWRDAQYSRQKTAYLRGLAECFASGDLDEDSVAALPDDEATARLLKVRGLGPWSVNYALLRGLGRLDALPVGDAGLRSALRLHFALEAPPGPEQQAALMEPLRPWRGLATYYLWKSLATERQE